jgi:F-type H+-transporting ATPase subunit epsilon
VATTQFELVTPTRTLYSGQAEMIVCRAVDGEIAFLANHMPYIGALDIGVVRIVGPGSDAETGALGVAGVGGASGATGAPEIRLAVHGGFVEVKDNQVIMLADEAELAEEVDVEAARRAETEANQAVSASSAESPDTVAEEALRWAQARLEAASTGG